LVDNNVVFIHNADNDTITESSTITAPYNLLNATTQPVIELNPSNGWSIDSNYGLVVDTTGFYQVDFNIIVSPYITAGSGLGNVIFTMQMGEIPVSGPWAPLNNGTFYNIQNTRVTLGAFNDPTTPSVSLQISEAVNLTAGVRYGISVFIKDTSTAGASLFLTAFSFSSFLISTVGTGLLPSESTDFMLAQTLRNFYNEDEHMKEKSEYLLDGIEVTTPSTFNMNIGTANSGAVQMYHFVDYTSAIVIDSEKVIVIA
jgi:hypothetical protein